MNLFITGGSRGLGREVVLEAARRGWGVAFTYNASAAGAEAVVKEATALSEGRGAIRTYQLDVRKSADVETVVDKACDDFDEIRAVVNNAALMRNTMTFSMTDEEWKDVIDTNLTGSFYVTRQFLQHFLANRFGKFVHVSSIAQDGCSGEANYAASKAALKGLSRTIAKEYGPKGIRSNVVVPGFMDTGMGEAEASEFIRNYWLQFCPLRRMCKANEFASVVLFLAGPDSDFISGEELAVGGGLDYSP